MSPVSTPPVGSLYVHVPFCVRKCAYCAFYSEVAEGRTIERYVRALGMELERVAGRLRPRTVYFGGGTPSVLPWRQWRVILGDMERLGLLGAAEWTVECNPASVTVELARLWRDYGVNRLSLGVQSLDAAVLERLGRVHTRTAAFRAFDLLRREGFDNVNVDLMFAIPGQTMASWRATLREAMALGSEHLSCYEVIYEEDTPLFEQLRAGAEAVDEDLACAMYEELVETVGQAGWRRYEIANFARETRAGVAGGAAARRGGTGTDGLPDGPGRDSEEPPAEFPAFACWHNLNYWRGGDFFGLGPGATTYVGGVRTTNVRDVRRYCDGWEASQRPLDTREALSPLARAGETAAFGLRVVAGWPFEAFQRVTGFDLRQEWAADMRQLVARGWGEWTAERFRLTPAGLRFADAAAELFLRPDTAGAEPARSP